MPLSHHSSAYRQAGVAPGGILIGFNYRETAGYVTDGDDEVWAGWLDNTPYPTSKTTPNGTTVDCGWSDLPGGRPYEGRDEVQRDPRFSGWVGINQHYWDREVWNVRLPVGTYRIRASYGRQAAGIGYECRLWDGTYNAGGRVMVKEFQLLEAGADEFYMIATPDAVVYPYADALTNYDATYWEMTLSDNGLETGIAIEANRESTAGAAVCANMQVEQV